MKAIMPPRTDQPLENRALSLLWGGAVLFILYAFNTPAFAANTDLKPLTKSDTKKFKSAFKTAKRG